MKPLRISVRAMVALVLVVTLACGVYALWRRSARYSQLAEIYAGIERSASESVAKWKAAEARRQLNESAERSLVAVPSDAAPSDERTRLIIYDLVSIREWIESR